MNIEACVKLNDWDKFVAMICKAQPMFCACGNIDVTGLPVSEQIGDELIQTGVICESCQLSYEWKLIMNSGDAA